METVKPPASPLHDFEIVLVQKRSVTSGYTNRTLARSAPTGLHSRTGKGHHVQMPDIEANNDKNPRDVDLLSPLVSLLRFHDVAAFRAATRVLEGRTARRGPGEGDSRPKATRRPPVRSSDVINIPRCVAARRKG